jgi:hypothetical protein
MQRSMEMESMEYAKRTIRKPLARLALFFALAVLAGFSFVRYLTWSFAYSGVMGLPSLLEQAQRAYHRACFFLCMFIALEIVLAITVASYFEPPDLSSAALRFVSRYGSGLAISVLFTAMLVGLAVVMFRV